MERAVEIFAVVNFVVIGLSHAVRPQMWVEFFSWLHARGHAGVLVHGFLSLGFGSVIVAFHPVWRGLPAVLTATGWLYLVKTGFCFLWPETQMRSLGRVAPQRAWELRLAGVVYLGLAAVLAYHMWAG